MKKIIEIDTDLVRVVPVDPTHEMMDNAFDDISLSDAHTEYGVTEHVWDYMLRHVPETLPGVVEHNMELVAYAGPPPGAPLSRFIANIPLPVFVPPTASTKPCMGCNGNGQIGGLLQDGYHGEECAFCQGSGKDGVAIQPSSTVLCSPFEGMDTPWSQETRDKFSAALDRYEK